MHTCDGNFTENGQFQLHKDSVHDRKQPTNLRSGELAGHLIMNRISCAELSRLHTRSRLKVSTRNWQISLKYKME